MAYPSITGNISVSLILAQYARCLRRNRVLPPDHYYLIRQVIPILRVASLIDGICNAIPLF